MSEDERAARMNRWQGATTYDALGEADLIIEAVFEDMDVAGRASWTSGAAGRGAGDQYVPIWTSTASRAPRAGRPTCWACSPANIMKLLEVVAGQSTPDTVATGFELARRLGKTPCGRPGDGFIGNRILRTGRRPT